MLKGLADDPNVSLDFVIDMHSHSTAMNAFCYVNLLKDNEALMLESLQFLRLLSTSCSMFSLSASRVCSDPAKTGTGRVALQQVVEEKTHCYTLEVSFFGYHTMGTRVVPFTQQSYLAIGRAVAATFSDFYKIS